MRLENILALTKGTLYSNPSVSLFETIAFEVSKVKRGSIFVAHNPLDIPEALSSGAYGILFDKPTQIADTEVAWIKVNNLDEALKRLLRFYLLEKELRVFTCDPILLYLANAVSTPANVCAIDGNVAQVWDKLGSLSKNSIVLFSPLLTDSEIFIETNPFPQTPKSTITIVEHTLFETSFIYDDIFYERQMLSPFFIPHLECLLFFYTQMEIPFQIKSFAKIGHFIPVFTNDMLEVKEFGSSDRVVIFEPLLELINAQIDFLDKQASWANRLYILPKILKAPSMMGVKNILFYEDSNKIMTLLQENSFHFALVAGVEKTILNSPRPKLQQLEMEF
jgi:ferrochelatase